MHTAVNVQPMATSSTQHACNNSSTTIAQAMLCTRQRIAAMSGEAHSAPHLAKCAGLIHIAAHNTDQM
jgi:hypothetical protein